jgi:dTDP-4-dehydrorhamnose reductase
MIKILIIGKKSFLGSNLTIYLSNFYTVDNFSYEEIILKDKIFFNQYTHIINTTIHPKYIKKRYNEKFDLDKKFTNKFKKFDSYYIFLNTRKIYLPKENINERSTLSPIDNYAKNKLITEKFLKKNLKSKLISLRISNIIGKRIFKNVRNNHKLFFDNFLELKIYKKKIILKNDFKDFLSLDQFCKIIYKIIKSNINGIYNVSISKKIYLSEIVSWLNKNTLKKINFIEPSNDSFTLSNIKLKKKIKITLTKNQLKLYCQKLI